MLVAISFLFAVLPATITQPILGDSPTSNDYSTAITVNYTNAPKAGDTCKSVKDNALLSAGVKLNDTMATKGDPSDFAKIEVMDNGSHDGLKDADVLEKGKEYSFLYYINTSNAENFSLGDAYPYSYLGTVASNISTNLDARGVKEIQKVTKHNCHSITAGNNTNTMLIDLVYTAPEIQTTAVSGKLLKPNGDPVIGAKAIFTYSTLTKDPIKTVTDENGAYIFNVESNNSGVITFEVEGFYIPPIFLEVGTTPIENEPSIQREVYTSTIKVSDTNAGQILKGNEPVPEDIELVEGTKLTTNSSALKVEFPADSKEESFELTASPKQGFEFKSWTIASNTNLNNIKNEEIIINSATTITANFAEASTPPTPSNANSAKTGDNNTSTIALEIFVAALAIFIFALNRTYKINK